MSVSLSCPDWPETGRRDTEWLPETTEGDLRWARLVYEQSAVFQGADVDRLIEGTDFPGADTRERLRATWGTAEALPAESLPFWQSCMEQAAAHWWRIPAACALAWLFVVVVLGGLGQ